MRACTRTDASSFAEAGWNEAENHGRASGNVHHASAMPFAHIKPPMRARQSGKEVRELNGHVCLARGEVGSLYTCPTWLDCCLWSRPLQRRYRSSGPSIAWVGNRKRSLPKSNIRSEKDPTVPRSPGCVLQSCWAPLVRCSARSK
jgi:hypothetical protein